METRHRPGPIGLIEVAGVIMWVALLCAAGSAWAQEGKPPADPKSTGPVQGYPGGYDPTDKSKAPTVKSGAPNDEANTDEGGDTRQVTGRVARVDKAAMTITLEDGRVFTFPPTLKVDGEILKPGTPVRIMVQRRDRSELITAVQVAEGLPR
jgi:Protein of unknown function (DUF1344)